MASGECARRRGRSGSGGGEGARPGRGAGGGLLLRFGGSVLIVEPSDFKNRLLWQIVSLVKEKKNGSRFACEIKAMLCNVMPLL